MRADDPDAASNLGGDTYITSQLFVPHPEYVRFGQPNTTDRTHYGGLDDISNDLLTTARMPAGAMRASKVIAIRSSLEDESC